MTMSRTAANQDATNHTFSLDLEAIKKHARQHIEEGAVTEGYKADRETILKLLFSADGIELHPGGLAAFGRAKAAT